MYSVRIHSELDDRLDAEFYNPEALQAIELIDTNCALSTLGQHISSGYRVVYHGTESVAGLESSETVAFLSPSQINDEGEIDFNSVDRLPRDYLTRYPKGKAVPGELLVEVKGNVAKVAITPQSLADEVMISGSLYKASLIPNLDPHYTLAYLKSVYGQRLKNRLTSNTIINYIGKDDLYSIPVPLLSPLTQKYIGDKVRQAEQLRAWTTNTLEASAEFHERFIPDQATLNFDRKHRRTPTKIMTDRFDAHFYPAVMEDYRLTPGVTFRKLNEVSLDIFNGQTQEETNEGLTVEQITVTNLSDSFLSGMPRQVKRTTTTQKYLRAGDLLLCNAAHNKTYIGKELTFYHGSQPILPSTEVMVIRVDCSQVPATYVRHFLLSKIGYVQLQSTIRGITAHSYPTDVGIIQIPIPHVPDAERQEWFSWDEKIIQAGIANENSTKLTTVAKLLVEALIGGKLSEVEVENAQQELEAGNRAVDESILNRLTKHGLDTAGDKLFPEVSDLYDFLDLSQRDAEDEA